MPGRTPTACLAQVRSPASASFLKPPSSTPLPGSTVSPGDPSPAPTGLCWNGLAGRCARTRSSRRCALAVTAAGAADDCRYRSGGLHPRSPSRSKCRVSPTVSQLDYDSNTGRFTAALTVTGEGMNPINTRISGRIEEMTEAPVALTRLLPETVLRADDVRIARVRTAMLQNEVARSLDQIVGMQLRRPVAAGQPLRLADLTRPPLVQRGATVQIELSSARAVRHRSGRRAGRRRRGRENPRAEHQLPRVPVRRGRRPRAGSHHARCTRGTADGTGAL